MNIVNSIMKNKIVAVIRGNSKEEAEKIIEGAIEGGIKVIEVTYTNKDASEIIRSLVGKYKNVIIGAGSVLTVDIAKEAIGSGSQFIVGPNFDSTISKYCLENKVDYIPGCFTPTEIVNALKTGVKLIKLFPGEAVDPKYIKSIKAPIKDLKIMVTGGVNLENIEEWLSNGADALGIGSILTLGTNNKHEKIASNAKKFMEKVKGDK
ncbi:bifunctional 4-hydroxy-2-oxoglutarate aldolase/2-dehydro-3-deoxy-phosphogluconate aldolase [Clostridium tagluense]|uniref:bifunctional 4-hydroxy-2-oxoglutarate aldolase/2-dehydro-3-deoxy-phosphogluconate aldolase n=1 Tax=Clostridium tagluense TaxID=360422 RepID=UPI001CF5E4E0|nr:bifunctional 4-hydroxy-2-oxoglutarate aldolase/2-dehydro-3-deoxy-phosphogluconate aldolase [Clostridium tagluense]MCB2298554.1 bifunctional 4-hydroxy-2-oxoglutarate aldolase/2-dehydro-3-deoxy-phosphogluconate aldolase [Clostridium tagluense]